MSLDIFLPKQNLIVRPGVPSGAMFSFPRKISLSFRFRSWAAFISKSIRFLLGTVLRWVGKMGERNLLGPLGNFAVWRKIKTDKCLARFWLGFDWLTDGKNARWSGGWWVEMPCSDRRPAELWTQPKKKKKKKKRSQSGGKKKVLVSERIWSGKFTNWTSSVQTKQPFPQ